MFSESDTKLFTIPGHSLLVFLGLIIFYIAILIVLPNLGSEMSLDIIVFSSKYWTRFFMVVCDV